MVCKPSLQLQPSFSNAILTHNHHIVLANPSVNANLPVLHFTSFLPASSPFTHHPRHSQYQKYLAATLPPSPIRHPPSLLPAAAAHP